jgi:hypothetical protein
VSGCAGRWKTRWIAAALDVPGGEKTLRETALGVHAQCGRCEGETLEGSEISREDDGYFNECPSRRMQTSRPTQKGGRGTG